MIADSRKPSSEELQGYINEHNYVEYLTSLFPAFLCAPETKSIHLVRNKEVFDQFLMSAFLFKRQTFPSPISHFMQKFDGNSHRNINKFFHENGYIPWLSPPKTYENSVDKFLNTLDRSSFLVTVNIRQRRRYSNIISEDISAAGLFRDSPMLEWRRLRIAQKQYPKVSVSLVRRLFYLGQRTLPAS